MKQPKKQVSIWTVLRIWVEKKIGTRCPECGGKASFHHYKRCSQYSKEVIKQEGNEPLICNSCADMDKFLIKECCPTPYNTCKEFKENK